MPENCNFDSLPLSQSREIRTPNLHSLDYTNQDFRSIKNRLIKYTEEKFGDTFNDFVESSIAIMLLENMAFLGDLLSFKIDQIANEPFIGTVTEIENAFRLCRLVGFEPTPPLAAKASFSLTLGSLLDVDMVIPTPLRIDVVANDVPTSFELFPVDENNNPIFDDDIVIPAGSFSNTSVVGIEGRTREDQFEGTGEQNQTYQLPESPVIFDSVRVDIDGVRWEQVKYFTDSQPRREYRIEFNSSWQAFIIFGNNTSGTIPPSGSTIVVTYRTGGGTIGNIVTGRINTNRPFEVPGFDISVPVEITNYTKAQFGYDGDTLDDIRSKLPAYLRSQDRAVTGDDYKTLTDQFVTSFNGQVGKSTAALRVRGCAGNVIDLFVLAKDGTDGLTNATNGLKVELAEMLNDKKMLTHQICIKDGSIIDVDVSIELTMDKFFKKFKDEIETKIRNKVNDFFSLRRWDYGDDLRSSDLIKSLSEIREVKRIDASFVTSSSDNSGETVTAKYYEIIRPDIITITSTFE